MPVVKTPRAIIEVLDAQGNIAGHEIENHYTFDAAPGEEDVAKMFTPRVIRDKATEDEVAALRKRSSEGLTAAHQALNAQIATMQQDAAAAKAAADAEIARKGAEIMALHAQLKNASEAAPEVAQ